MGDGRFGLLSVAVSVHVLVLVLLAYKVLNGHHVVEFRLLVHTLKSDVQLDQSVLERHIELKNIDIKLLAQNGDEAGLEERSVSSQWILNYLESVKEGVVLLDGNVDFLLVFRA